MTKQHEHKLLLKILVVVSAVLTVVFISGAILGCQTTEPDPANRPSPHPHYSYSPPGD